VRAGRRLEAAVHGALLLLLAIYSIFPIYMVTIESLKTVDEDVFGNPFYVAHPNFDWYAGLFDKEEWISSGGVTRHPVPFLVWTGNTLIVFSATLVVILTASLAAAYALARLRFRGAALLGIIVLSNIGGWYRRNLGRLKRKPARVAPSTQPFLSHRRVVTALVVLIVLIFSKYFYLASIGNYYTFYLIDKFHVSVPTAQFHLFLFLFSIAAGTRAARPNYAIVRPVELALEIDAAVAQQRHDDPHGFLEARDTVVEWQPERA